MTDKIKSDKVNELKVPKFKGTNIGRIRPKMAAYSRAIKSGLKAGWNPEKYGRLMKKYNKPQPTKTGRKTDPESLLKDRYGSPLSTMSSGETRAARKARFDRAEAARAFAKMGVDDESLERQAKEKKRQAKAKEREEKLEKLAPTTKPKTRAQIKAELEAKKQDSTDIEDSTDIVRGARMALAEACWKGYKAKGMKKKGNRMVPNCVREGALDDLPTRMKLAARKAKAKGEDPVDAVEKIRKDTEAKADKEHYGKKEESDDPRMKTTPASIQQAGGDPEAYKQEKAKKDPKPTSKKSKKPSRRATVGRGGGKYRRQRIQPPKGHEGPSAPTRQVSVAGDAEGDQKKNFQKGSKEKPLSKKQINRMGVRGQEKKIADEKKGKTGAANIQLMRDMGVLKTDSRGRVTLAKKKR